MELGEVIIVATPPSLVTVVYVCLLQGATITEDEFATKIEEVLKSKHQPNLLPFLKVYLYMYTTIHYDARLHVPIQCTYMCTCTVHILQDN